MIGRSTICAVCVFRLDGLKVEPFAPYTERPLEGHLVGAIEGSEFASFVFVMDASVVRHFASSSF
jgi:hypothetical protein